MGIAILVTADPGTEAEEGTEAGRRLAEDLGPAPVQLGVDGGDDLEQQGEMGANVARLVGDGGPGGVQLLGLPQELDVLGMAATRAAWREGSTCPSSASRAMATPVTWSRTERRTASVGWAVTTGMTSRSASAAWRRSRPPSMLAARVKR